MPKVQEERISKILSTRGVCSRREAERLIAEGRIKRNGRPVQIGDKAMPMDLLTVDGIEVGAAPEKIYIILNKPRGYVTTTHDEQGRKCVTELVSDLKARIYPVGRLDKESEGLLLMTNDGEFANLMSHPKHEVAKVYRVTVHPKITPEQEVKLLDGIEDDGEWLLARSVTLMDEDESRSVLQMVLIGGKNRQIRRMCEAVGLEVARLKRVSEGGIKLGMLPTGRWRHLEPSEVRLLKSASRGETEVERGGQAKRAPSPHQAAEKSASSAAAGSYKPSTNYGRTKTASSNTFHRSDKLKFKKFGFTTDKPGYRKNDSDKSGSGNKVPSNSGFEKPRYSDQSGNAKPTSDRYDKPRTDFKDKPSYAKPGEKPGYSKPTSDRYDKPRTDFKDKPSYAKPGEKPAYSKPTSDRYDKPRSDFNKPSYAKPGEKPSYSKPTTGRSDKPRSDFNKPSYAKPGEKPGYSKPTTGRSDKPRSDFNKPSYAKPGEKPGYSKPTSDRYDKPRTDFKDKPSYAKPGEKSGYAKKEFSANKPGNARPGSSAGGAQKRSDNTDKAKRGGTKKW